MSQLLPDRRSRLAPEGWEPLSELEQVTQRMRRMLDQTFGDFGWPSPAEARGWSPLVDIEEADDAYVVEAELPGIKREDVNIELVGNELTITGEVRRRERKGALRRQTRHTGRFAQPHHRVIGVMQDINEENKIELVIRAWQLVAAEGLHGNMGLRSRPGVNRQPLQIGPARQHLTGEQAVAAAHVEDGNIGRDQFAEMASEDADATLMNLSIVNSADEPHLRCIPRMLIKKLERMV